MQKEIWKDIDGYVGMYMVSSFGRVKRCNRVSARSDGILFELPERILTPFSNGSGYMCVHLCVKSKTSAMTVHRLVANSFIPNPLKKDTVNHKNGIKSDNRLSNLEFNTVSENIKHAYSIGLR